MNGKLNVYAYCVQLNAKYMCNICVEGNQMNSLLSSGRHQNKPRDAQNGNTLTSNVCVHIMKGRRSVCTVEFFARSLAERLSFKYLPHTSRSECRTIQDHPSILTYLLHISFPILSFSRSLSPRFQPLCAFILLYI